MWPRRPARSVAAAIFRWRGSPDLGAKLERCSSCGHDFVIPVDWESVGRTRWWILLRCGECGIWREVTVPDAVADRFDAELNRRTAILVRALDGLDRERMANQIEAIIVALNRDLIDAADFAT